MLLTVFYFIALLLAVIYLWMRFWKWTYWTKKNVYQIQPSFPFGNFASFFMKKEHLNDYFMTLAKDNKDKPYIGAYFMQNPVLLINDTDLAKTIMIKDFEYFVDRNSSMMLKMFQSGTRTDEIWAKQMTNASGNEWKDIRSTFSPIFTSGKMKAMMVFMDETCNQLMNGIDEYAKTNEAFELKEMLGKYSMDTIASCAFGVNAEAFSNKQSKFVEYASHIFEQRLIDMVKLAVAVFLPGGNKILSAMKTSVMRETETEFFYSAIMSSLNHRRQTKTRRNDLIDLMLDAIKGEMETGADEEEEQFEKDAKLDHSSHHSKKTFDELVIVATAIVLLVAGYDTTGTTLAFALYELAKNQDIQERLRSEVEEKTNGDPDKALTYDDLQSMTYLDQVISETLRFHTPIAILQRATTKEYNIPGTNFTIEKDTSVWTNVMGIHFDSKNYANPLVFDPDHFSKEAKSQRNPYAFLPFGQGPRGCIGMRFALLEAKLALASIVRKYNLSPSSKTQEPLELDPTTAIAYVKHGLYIKAEQRI